MATLAKKAPEEKRQRVVAQRELADNRALHKLLRGLRDWTKDILDTWVAASAAAASDSPDQQWVDLHDRVKVVRLGGWKPNVKDYWDGTGVTFCTDGLVRRMMAELWDDGSKLFHTLVHELEHARRQNRHDDVHANSHGPFTVTAADTFPPLTTEERKSGVLDTPTLTCDQCVARLKAWYRRHKTTERQRRATRYADKHASRMEEAMRETRKVIEMVCIRENTAVGYSTVQASFWRSLRRCCSRPRCLQHALDALAAHWTGRPR